MNILGIDTTTKEASVTVSRDDVLWMDSTLDEVTHSEKLLPLINSSLKKHNLTLDNISLLAAINGPGSFTGIRIGLATIKAFAQVKNIPIFSISSIELMAYATLEKLSLNEATVLSLIDAKNSRVYYGINKVTMNEDRKISIEKIKDVDNELIDDILPTLKDYNSLVVAGNCVNTFREKLLPFSQKLLDMYPTSTDLISCYLNLKEEEKEKYMYNAYSLDALYARPSQAERMAKK